MTHSRRGEVLGAHMAEWKKLDEGIRARVHPTRKHGVRFDMYYVLRYTVDGQKRQEALGWASEGWTLAKARNELMKLKEAARTGDGPATLEEKRKKAQEERALEQKKPTVDRLWEFYDNAHAGRASAKSDKSNYAHLKTKFGSLVPDQIRTAHLDDLKGRLFKKKYSPQTVKHVLGLLRRIIRYAEKRGLCVLPPPSLLCFEIPTFDNIKTECLNEQQFKALMQALDEEQDQVQASIMRLALVTGMRKGALLGLKWSHVDFEKEVITLDGNIAKNGKTSYIPMTKAAKLILEGIERTSSPYVFPGKNGKKRIEIRRMAKRVKLKAGLPSDFRPLHGLRHTYASYLANSGTVPLYTIQRLLTQESPDVTKRYAHLSDETLRKAGSVADIFYSMAKEDKNKK